MNSPKMYGILAMAALALWTSESGHQCVGQTSPEVLSDGRVTFRFRSAEADNVKAAGQFGPEVVLSRGDDNQWTGTTKDPVPPGVFEYRFEVDGLRLIDPRNSAIKPQRWPGSSILHVPASPPAVWDLRPQIPHGTVHHHGYSAASLGGAWRNLVVYTPPNAAEAGPLPVLYLAHGYSDEEKTWTVHGKAHWILDALIADEKAVPMIVVMPDAHAVAPESRGDWNSYATANTEAFCRELVSDIIPLIEKHYSVRKDAAGRGFAGLSMGGHHALTVALQYSGTFSHIGAFSSAPPGESTVNAGLENVDEINEQLKLLWIACGDKDFLFDGNQKLHAAFEDAGLRHEYVVTEGENHSWPVWRRYLARFTPMLFR